MKKLLIAATAFVAISANAQHPGSEAAMRLSYMQQAEARYNQFCIACHGNRGQGGIGPSLQGQETEYLAERLNSYRAGETVGSQSATMWGQTSNLSDELLQALAEYIEALDN